MGSYHFVDSGFSILKNDYWNIFIKYKENNTNHSHPDKLNIEIKTGNDFLTHDLSTSGYGSNISKNFYKKSYSHNTIVINGENQNLECETTIIDYNDNRINIKVKNIYDNVNISRKIQLLKEKLTDQIEIDYCNKNVDYFFHCDANLITKLDFEDRKPFKEYPYLKNIRKIKSKNDDIILKWNLDNKIIISKINIKNKQLYISKSPDNPDIKNRTTLIIRSKEKEKISFKIEWHID